MAGNRSVTNSEILSRVRSRVGEVFDPNTAAQDARRIAELAGVEYSYYNTAIVENKIRLIFVVVERNLVRSIVFFGNSKVKSSTLRKKLELKTGDYLDPLAAETSRKTLLEYYRKKGFAFVEVKLDDEKLRRGELLYTINEGPRVKIDSVKFSGNSALKTKQLKNTIKTKNRKLLLLPAYYVEEYVDKDLTRLKNIYYERGFLDVGVTAKRQFNKAQSKVRLTFVIDEGTAYVVETITFSGNKNFEEKQLREGLKLHQGRTYNQRKADSDVSRILKLYRENGFIDAKVKRNVSFISKDKVNVEFAITEGERFRIGRINITGNEQTQDKVIRRVLDEYDFKPGRWYNADIARGDGSGELERNIRRMVLTESATITPSGETPGQKDAQVSVIEGQTGMVMLGAGVSSDAGAIGQLIFEQKNFDIKDKPKSFSDFITGKAFKGAGQSLRIALEPGTERSRYSINFTEPYFMNRPISLDVIGESFEWERECYDENRMRGYISFEKRYRNHWRRSVGLRVENVDVDNVDSDAPKEIKDVKGDNMLFGIKLGVAKDLTDDRFNPSKGYYFRANYEQVAGDHTFGILSGTYSRYKTLYEDLAERKTILSTKLHAATVVGDAPPFEKFYAGGSRSIRGFDYRGVSTRGGSGKDPIGSDWIFLANAEVTVPMVGDNLSALFFVDTGAIDSGNYRASVGTGIQIMIPQWFGPVPMRFEIATPLMKDGDDDTQVFSFSVGRLF
ncbi:MAG: outer membrane protein assembly factor BamA [Planctomycetota bacterium]|nr:MAG: outer membrane protein assembly factor BamA [Planctomycetota bacterium]